MKTTKRNNLHTIADITKISVKYNAEHLEFYTSDGCKYYTQTCISCSSGVRSIQLPRWWEDERCLNSTVSFREDELIPLFKACRVKLSKINKEALAHKALELFNEFYGNICLGDFPQGTDPKLRAEEKKKHNPNAKLWDYLPDVQIGSKTITKEEIRDMLK
jgi:hypothetical protein